MDGYTRDGGREASNWVGEVPHELDDCSGLVSTGIGCGGDLEGKTSTCASPLPSLTSYSFAASAVEIRGDRFTDSSTSCVGESVGEALYIGATAALYVMSIPAIEL